MEKINYSGVNETLYHYTLDNGFEVFLLPNDKVSNFYMTYNIKYGSNNLDFKVLDENKNIKLPYGVAHFLEHLTFKMPNGKDASNYFSELGSNINAYTSYDSTTYEVLATNHFKENLKYLIKYVNTPAYTKKNVEEEKGIICEEIKMYKDKPARVAYETLLSNIIVNDNYQYIISGEVDDVKNTNLEDIKNAYEYFYRFNNSFLVITGNFNKGEAIAIIEEEISKYEHKNYNVENKKITEPLSVKQSNILLEDNVETPRVFLGIKIPFSKFSKLSLSEEELYACLALIINCNFGDSSEIIEELVNGNIICGGLGIEINKMGNYFVIVFNAITEYPKRFINILTEKINNLVVDKEDINRKKRVAISSYIQSFDNIEFTNCRVVDNIIYFKKLIDNSYDIYNNIKYDTVSSIAKKINNKYQVCVQLNCKKEDK